MTGGGRLLRVRCERLDGLGEFGGVADFFDGVGEPGGGYLQRSDGQSCGTCCGRDQTQHTTELACRLDDGADRGNNVGRQADRGGEGFTFGDATECAACTGAGDLRAGLGKRSLIYLDADVGGVLFLLDPLDFLLGLGRVGF